jgi:hypothetical protein
VFLRLVVKISNRFLEQRINIKFCVKVGTNASDTCEMISEASWGEAMKNSSVSEWHKRFRDVMSKSRTKTMLISFFDIKGMVHFISFQKATQSTKFIMPKIDY